MKEASTIYDDLTATPNFQGLSSAFQAIFPEAQDFSNYVYADGVNITRYLIALEEADSVKAICSMVNELLKEKGYDNLVKSVSKDKTAAKFMEKWLRGQNIQEEVIRKFNGMSSRSRNTYSYFLTLLIRYSVVKDAE
jgi:hypothetical protein